MPTPNELALLAQLARRATDLKKIADLRNATMGSAKLIEAAYMAEVAAQAELATAAAEMGVPLAEAAAMGTTAAGTGATATAATGIAAWFTWPAILAGVAIVGAVTGGGYIYTNWGKPSVEPVKARPAMLGNHLKPTFPDTPVKPASSSDVYYIYAINTSGWSFYIGRPSDVEGRPGRQFQDGGTGEAPVEFKKLVDKKFNSASEAKAYLKARVTPGKQSVWTGTWMKFEGGEECRMVHVGF
ncbi:MAG TPA: hypothetical protein PLN21_18615 [Gemmatales bacterium]|nr:hypothetical protein [Gemmatales bacterium]